MKAVLLAVIAALALSTSPASAEEVPPVEAAHVEHDGLLLRATPGFGAPTNTHGEDTLTIRGPNGRLGLSVGYAVIPRLIGTGDFVAHTQSNSETMAREEAVWRGTYAGIGINWYTGGNFYLAASMGAAHRSLKIAGMPEMNGTGFGTKLDVGKEWWVSPDAGMGIAFELLLGNHVYNDDTFAVISLMFSATYN